MHRPCNSRVHCPCFIQVFMHGIKSTMTQVERGEMSQSKEAVEHGVQ